MEQKAVDYYKRKDRELGKNGETVLGCLVEEGHFGEVEKLLENGFSFGSRDRELLLNCAQADDPATIPFLVKHGFDPNFANEAGETALHLTNSGDVARALVGAGANPNLQDSYGNTALHTAFDGKLATALLENGSDLKIRNFAGETPCEALGRWAKADFGNDGYDVVLKSTEAREQKDELMKSLTASWKPSDCKEEQGALTQEPAQARRRLM